MIIISHYNDHGKCCLLKAIVHNAIDGILTIEERGIIELIHLPVNYSVIWSRKL
ncbi:hypothetical protein [Flavobacterium sp.]|uniref:hypothetical protein n=1 Tax=Flavobacterium sp. TaxID=239 RepID=UPI003264BD60